MEIASLVACQLMALLELCASQRQDQINMWCGFPADVTGTALAWTSIR